MKYAEGFVRVTNLDGKVVVESDSLAVALTTLAGHLRDGEAFSIRGRKRSGRHWTVEVPVTIPAQRQPVHQPCGCLTNDTGAHRGDCPDFVTRMDGDGVRYWTRRPAPACTCPVGDVHSSNCPAWAPGRKEA